MEHVRALGLLSGKNLTKAWIVEVKIVRCLRELRWFRDYYILHYVYERAFRRKGIWVWLVEVGSSV